MSRSSAITRRLGTILIEAFLVLFCALFFFVLSVTDNKAPTVLIAALAIIYLFFWLLITGAVLVAGCQMVGLRPPRFIVRKLAFNTKKDKSFMLLLAGTSYVYMIMGFALSYMLISHYDPRAFNLSNLDAITGIYFSGATIATVGFGDIYPVSMLARLFVISEIAIGLLYPLFFFSIVATFIKGKS
jgi:hypothetical protein